MKFKQLDVYYDNEYTYYLECDIKYIQYMYNYLCFKLLTQPDYIKEYYSLKNEDYNIVFITKTNIRYTFHIKKL